MLRYYLKLMTKNVMLGVSNERTWFSCGREDNRHTGNGKGGCAGNGRKSVRRNGSKRVTVSKGNVTLKEFERGIWFTVREEVKS